MYVEKKESSLKQTQRAYLNEMEFCRGASIKTSLACIKSSRAYEVVISDCNNEITLHGSLNDKKNINNARRKLDTIIEALMNMRGFIDRNEEQLLKKQPKPKKKIRRTRAIKPRTEQEMTEILEETTMGK
jgi:hypothetical protein